jgi:diketogulonate reductase-like aldo/keto reductase
LDEIARARQASPAQVVLAWLTRDPLVFAIPKSSDRGRSAENARAMGIALSDDEIRRLDQAFPARRRKSLPTL